MKQKLIGALASVAWAAAVISGAAPADAKIVSTINQAAYITCGANYSSYAQSWCVGSFWSYYYQQIRFHQTACNSGPGSCATEGSVYCDFVYSTGRKQVTSIGSCDTFYKLYEAGTCAC